MTATKTNNASVKNKIRYYLKWIGWVLLIQFILFNISAALYAYKFTSVYDVVPENTGSGKSNIFTRTWRLFSGPLQRKIPSLETPVFKYEINHFTLKNGIKVESWYAHPDSTSKGTVILFHGWLGNKSLLIPEASEFLYQGYSVLMVDFRAHGNSEGHITTIGISETEEVKLAWDFIEAKGEKNIYLYGISMGAVTVSRAVSEYQLKPTGLILEMPFESTLTVIKGKARAQGFQNFTIHSFAFLVNFWMGVERGIPAFKHKTVNYVSKINCPILLQWGARDIYVQQNETETIFKAITSKNKKLVVYANAGHESLLNNESDKWRYEVESFLKETNNN